MPRTFSAGAPAILAGALVACMPAGQPLTPLIRAAREGRPETIRRLVASGADPDAPGGVNHWTPLLHAIHTGRRDSARALLDTGADPNLRGGGGVTPLIMAAGYGYTGIVRDLLARGADPYAQGRGGANALSAAVGGAADIDRFTVGSCQADTVRALLDRAPALRLPSSFQGWRARVVARAAGCDSVTAALERAR